jgi:hypothetical protein
MDIPGVAVIVRALALHEEKLRAVTTKIFSSRPSAKLSTQSEENS